MALTRSFKETVRARVQNDPAYREAMLGEAIQTFLNGEVQTGKALLRDYVNATVGFEALGAAVGIPPKSLLRMLGPRGNPQANNLFAIIRHLQTQAHLDLVVSARTFAPSSSDRSAMRT